MTGSSLATWRGSPNHYNGRNGYRVDHITLHIMVGTLESCANWFSPPQSQAASHYGVGPDRIYQFVDEDNGSWADANMASDCSGITIEHQGGIEDVPVTDAEVELSARLCADISRRYGLGRLVHNGLSGNVYLHREIPGTDHFGCPDRTVNGLPVDRIINRANQLLEGDTDVVTQQDIAAIAAAVWGYNYKGSAPGGNMYNNLVYEVPERVAGAVATYTWADKDGNGKPVGGNLYNQARQTALTVIELKAQVAALNAAVEALGKSMGADPEQIAKTIQETVKAKLGALEINVTATAADATD